MLKQKLKKILPWYIFGLLGLIGAQIAPTFLMFPPKTRAVVLAPVLPQVLGEQTLQARGSSQVAPVLHARKIQDFDPAVVSADAFLVYDATTGDILLSKNPEQKYPIASLTKLMTALVSYQNSRLDTTLTVTPEDLLPVSPALNLKIGDTVELQDLFSAMLVGSVNDAAQTLANHTARNYQNFIDQMNQTARNLAMTNTHFDNPLGFDSSSNYSTAMDLKNLVQQTQKLAAFKILGRRTQYSFTSVLGNAYSTKATNKLIQSHTEIVAIKSGSTPEAKESLISGAQKQGRSIVIIVLSSNNREKDTLSLENLVFENFVWE